MNSDLKKILQEISSHANRGRLNFEAVDPAEEEDPLATPDEEEDDSLDSLFGGSEEGGDGMNTGMEPENPEDEIVDAEAEKAKAQADAMKAQADAAQAQAEKEKSAAEREKAEAEVGEFNGIDIFSRPGVAFLVGQLLDDYSSDNKLDQLAQQFVSKLRMDDEGFQEFKAQSGPLLKLKGFQELLNRMESTLKSHTDNDIETATVES